MSYYKKPKHRELLGFYRYKDDAEIRVEMTLSTGNIDIRKWFLPEGEDEWQPTKRGILHVHSDLVWLHALLSYILWNWKRLQHRRWRWLEAARKERARKKRERKKAFRDEAKKEGLL